MTDLKLTRDSDRQWDISIDPVTGDFAIDDSMNTAIEMTVRCQRRADASQVATPEYRRGWIGNELSDVPEFQQGSLLWLLYQAKLTDVNADLAADFLNDAFAWMVEDGLLAEAQVAGQRLLEGVRLSVKLKRTDGRTESRLFDLWENTVNAPRLA